MSKVRTDLVELATASCLLGCTAMIPVGAIVLMALVVKLVVWIVNW